MRSTRLIPAHWGPEYGYDNPRDISEFGAPGAIWRPLVGTLTRHVIVDDAFEDFR